jgi:anti-sigma regulatory factor (Ser/Thr protein kinase)
MPATAENLHSARRLLREWLISARWPRDEIEQVVVAVNEAMSNAIGHAYLTAAAPPGRHRSVDVHGVVEPASSADQQATGARAARVAEADATEALWRARIEIVDHGMWRLSDVDLHDQLRHRGRGLPMMEALMDQVTIGVAPGGGTRVALIKNVTMSEVDRG